MAFWIIKLMVFLLYFTNWGSTKCVGDYRKGVFRPLSQHRFCPDPTSFGRVCVEYFDQCPSNGNCTVGQQCCLVAGCGKECMRVCPLSTSFGRRCDWYFDQCQSNGNCAPGQQCCLVAGCGKECIRELETPDPVSLLLPVEQ